MELEPKAPSSNNPIDEVVRRIATSFDSKPNPPADPEVISQLEQNLGTSLPPSYKEVLRNTNGGTFYQTVELFGFNTNKETPNIDELMKTMRQKGLPTNLIPVAQSVVTVCLDTTRPDNEHPGEYKITLWNQYSRLMKQDERTFAQWLKDTADQYS